MLANTILVTGACGEIGHSLIPELAAIPNTTVVAIDIKQTDVESFSNVIWISGDILDKELINDLFQRYQFTKVFHLAAILSSSGERDPFKAHGVNVEGSITLLSLAHQSSVSLNLPLQFIFPSTMAIYGNEGSLSEMTDSAVNEDQSLFPKTMYGANKLYIEEVGWYISRNFSLLDHKNSLLDFRSVRFPGILSATSTPSGGTSDFAPEMIHAAAKGVPYSCFVTPDSTIPFMSMPDAVQCLMQLMNAPLKSIKLRSYNVTSFSVSAEEIRLEVLKHFPDAKIDYKINPERLEIVKSWPRILDDSRARTDWGWQPQYDFKETFSNYLVPGIKKRYKLTNVPCHKGNDECINGG